jgi:hypothetical protein
LYPFLRRNKTPHILSNVQNAIPAQNNDKARINLLKNDSIHYTGQTLLSNLLLCLLRLHSIAKRFTNFYSPQFSIVEHPPREELFLTLYRLVKQDADQIALLNQKLPELLRSTGRFCLQSASLPGPKRSATPLQNKHYAKHRALATNFTRSESASILRRLASRKV